MSKRNRLQMDSFSPTAQPDEGYSEDPLNPLAPNSLHGPLSSLRSPADLPAWIAANGNQLPVSLKSELVLALLSNLPTSVILEIVERQSPRLYIDFIRKLPPEICLRILSYLDPGTIIRVIQTCRAWCDLALDSKLWERLYHLEGWHAIRAEIESSEAKVNVGLNDSITHLHRIQNPEGQTNKIRAIVQDTEDKDTDVTMTDNDRILDRSDSNGSWSLFASPKSSFTQSRILSMSDVDSEAGSASLRRTDTDLSQEQRSRRRDPHFPTERSLPPILPPQDPRALRRSTLWMWDVNRSRYRINWKYLYDMRRRLESNWELGKFTTFQFPHPLHPEEGHSECIYSLQFDSNFLVSGSRDNTMRIWNIHTRRLIRSPLAEHTGSVLCLQFDADPQEDIIVSGSSDSDVIVWRFSTGEVIQKLTSAHSESVLNVRFDKRILVTSSKDKTIKIFNRRLLRQGDMGYSEALVDPVGINVRRYGYEPEVYNDLPTIRPFTMIARLEGHGAAVNAIQIREDTVISVSGDRQIKVWNWPKQFCSRTIPAHDKGIACVEYDGRRIVSGSSDHKVYIFDAATGVNVADLKGHTALVRTVQAGFADLPYSQTEDELEARRADAERLMSGDIDLGERASSRSQRRRRASGAMQPNAATSYGAKLPQGGGGGRVYGRIVSGSYDHSIIIWRRDKEGGWIPAHHLRQEEAAVLAQRQAHLSLQAPSMAMGELDQVPSYAPIRPLVPQPPTAAGYQLQSMSQMATLPMPNVHDAQPYLASSVYTALIDQVVPAGPASLERALTNYPGILAYHNYMRAIIQRESSPAVRERLMEVVTEALFSTTNVQWHGHSNNSPQSARVGQSAAANTATSSMAALASSSSGGSSAPTAQRPQPAPTDTPQPQPAQTVTATPATQPQRPATREGRDHDHVAEQGGTRVRGHAVPAPMLGVVPENVPQRIFKLQFDARKIICCSQSATIVGWDFCNGDPELEEASRFFATVG